MGGERALREAWAQHAADWIAWARAPEHDDFFWRFNLPNLLSILPTPSGLTIDLGCGEGRLARELSARGYRVLGCDASYVLVRAARTMEGLPLARADASQIPVRAGAATLVVASMVLQDLDDLEGAIQESARVLCAGGHLCFCVPHPVNTAGSFGEHNDGEIFALRESYFCSRRYSDRLEKDGLAMTFEGTSHPLERYTRSLESAGLAIEALREPRPEESWAAERPRVSRWRQVPNSLHVRAIKLR